MEEDGVYRLATGFVVFLWGFVVLVVLLIAVMLLQLDREGWPTESVRVLIGVVGIVVVLATFGLRRGVIRIEVEGDSVTFVSVLRRTETAVSEIRRIWTRWWDVNRVNPVIEYSGGKVTLAGPFDRFYDLVATLRQRNPGISIRRL